MRKVLTPPKRPKTKTSISSDKAYRGKLWADSLYGTRGVYKNGKMNTLNKSGYLAENAVIPVGASDRTNKVRWKKPSPVIKRTTKRK